jgi:hypothetical protein
LDYREAWREEKKSNRDMEAHRQGEEREEDLKDVPVPGSRGYGMARQCSRGPNSCESRVGADVTPANPNTNQYTVADAPEAMARVLRAAPAPGQPRSTPIVGEDERSPEFVEANLREIQNGGDSPGEGEKGKTTRTDR